MAAPAVYLDECVDQPLADALRERGFTVLTAREAANLALTDERQLEDATRLGMVTLSYNRLHFIRLHAAFTQQSRAHGGIVLLPQGPPLSRRVLRAAMMLDWIADKEPQSQLFTWGILQQELLRGHRFGGATYSEDDVQVALGRR